MPILCHPETSQKNSNVNDLIAPVAEAGVIDEVYCCPSTGEVFPTYEEYVKRLELYHGKVWKCRYTGKGGLKYLEALKCEGESIESLNQIDEWWRPYIIQAIHCSLDPIETLINKLLNYFKNHLVIDEPVGMLINDSMHWGRVSQAPNPSQIDISEEATSPVTAESSMTTSPTSSAYSTLAAIYRIYINEDDFVVDGACKSVTDVKRNSVIPTKTLLKKYIRFVATKLAPGLPWLVHDRFLTKYNIAKALSPEMAEKVRLIRVAREERVKNATASSLENKSSQQSQGQREDGSGTVVYPILEEFIPNDRRIDPSLWPIPRKFNSSLDVVKKGCIQKVLDIWHFINCFGTSTLKIAPFTLDMLISSLEYKGCEGEGEGGRGEYKPNPIFDTICLTFGSQLATSLRSAKVREERIDQYLGKGPASELPPFVPDTKEKEESEQDNEEEDNIFGDCDNLVDFLHLFLTRKQVTSFLAHGREDLLQFFWSIRRVSVAKRILLHLKEEKYYSLAPLDGSMKLEILDLLLKFYVTCVSLRPVVDKEVEIASDAKQDVRELESERRRLGKEISEWEEEQAELTTKLENEKLSNREVRSVKEKLRQVERKINSLNKSVLSSERKIEKLNQVNLVHSVVKMIPLGEDGTLRRYWWLDTPSSSATDHTGCGILLVEDGQVGEWSFYDEVSQVEQLISWLNPLGSREARLLAKLNQHKEAIVKSLRPFIHGENSQVTVAESVDDSDSDDELVVVVSSRKRRLSQATNKKRTRSQEAPFLQYSNK